MPSENERISSLDASHGLRTSSIHIVCRSSSNTRMSSGEEAEIGTSTQTRNTWYGPKQVWSPLWAQVRPLTSAKTVINSNGASHTSGPNSAQIRRNSSANTRINLVEANRFFNKYSVQIACKSSDNTFISSYGGSYVSSLYSAHTDWGSGALRLIPSVS